ncbi:hypothetical protein EW026_g713 [Hermanssonia centrifuga]|uniref:Uncharacterized protein n=1 Tax=Hermanssonia centrifuga TaxID=98765 RepID=A0A4S4KTS7_9APHY|nr:hypothetical protein EW026_g713 [Hermanssonia centrifuga]
MDDYDMLGNVNNAWLPCFTHPDLFKNMLDGSNVTSDLRIIILRSP